MYVSQVFDWLHVWKYYKNYKESQIDERITMINNRELQRTQREKEKSYNVDQRNWERKAERMIPKGDGFDRRIETERVNLYAGWKADK